MFKVDVTRPKDRKKKRRKSPVNEQIKHQITLRGQYTRIAKQAVNHLKDLRSAVKGMLDEAVESSDWATSNKLHPVLSNIDRSIKDQYAALGRDLTDDLADLVKYEIDHAADAHGATFSSPDIDEMSIYSLVTDDPFDGKVLGEWLTEQEQGTQLRIKQTIRLGIVNGLSTNDIVSAVVGDKNNPYKVNGPFSKALRNAETLVRTAAAHVTARADMAAFENSGIEKYKLSSILDSRTTTICGGLDGKIYSVNDPNKKIPPFHPNCRTTMIAIFDDEPVIDKTFQQWLGEQDEETQIKSLGKARFKLWKSGVSIDRFVDDETAELIPLDELRKQLKR